MEVLQKLQLKDVNVTKLVINANKEYLEELLNEKVNFDTEVEKESYEFIQIFGVTNNELSHYSDQCIKFLNEDGLFWICYPKKSSKKYKGSDCDRDSVASLLSKYNFEPVRQVAIDEDFSAIRFRHVSNIKTMIRKIAFTEEGKKRIENENT